MADRPESFSPDHLPGRLRMRKQDRQRILVAARQFRRSPTPGEEILWQELRGRKLGVKFRRRHPVGPLIVDFCCPDLRLIVEVDGPVHDEQIDRDSARQRLLEDRGYRVLRLNTETVEKDLQEAVDQIKALVQSYDIPSPKLSEEPEG